MDLRRHPGDRRGATPRAARQGARAAEVGAARPEPLDACRGGHQDPPRADPPQGAIHPRAVAGIALAGLAGEAEPAAGARLRAVAAPVLVLFPLLVPGGEEELVAEDSQG